MTRDPASAGDRLANRGNGFADDELRRQALRAQRSRGAGRRTRRRGARRLPAASSWSVRTICGSTASESEVSASAGVRADLVVAVAAAREQAGRTPIRRRGNTRRSRATRTGVAAHSRFKPRRHRLHVLLVTAMIAEKHDVAKSVQPEAACRVLERRLERRIGNGDRARKAHVRRRRRDAALGHVGDDRRHQRIAERERDPFGERRAPARCACRASCAGRSARSRRWGPARSSCRRRLPASSSGEVRSSMNTGAGDCANAHDAATKSAMNARRGANVTGE